MAKRYYSAAEAAARLGVAPATLYSYVSRGLVRSEQVSGNSRARRYRAEDVDVLRARAAQRRNPAAAAEQALQWGMPVLESKLTLIEEGRVFFRGEDAVELAARSTFEEVAALLWTGRPDPEVFGGEPLEVSDRPGAVLASLEGLRAIERMQVALVAAAGEDAGAYDLRPAAVLRAGGRILRVMACAAVGGSAGAGSLAGALRAAWAPGELDAGGLLDAALVLCADHELNVSAFTARCAASAGSHPYAAVVAGLSALQGGKHGGHTERVEALLREVGEPGRARVVLRERLRRGEPIPGFGQRLYPSGDPRGWHLLALVAAARPDSEAVATSRAVAEAAAELIDERPTIDFALVTLARALGLPEGAPLTLFALGRAAGWIGHIIEQYADDRLIRPRARYTGRQPRG